MNILGIDTSTKKANVCIKKGEEIINKSIDNEITHSEKLLPLIDECLNEANLSLSDMDCLACSIGPGSFTGIRIGIATIKAFAKVLNVPIYAFSSLDILAYTNIDVPSNYVISLMDAKNSRVYYCLYKANKMNNISILKPLMDYSNDIIDIALENINNVIANENLTSTSSIKIIGDCATNYKDICINSLTNSFNDINIMDTTMSSDVIIKMVENYLKCGYDNNTKKDYLTLDALYVRPSQAERAKNNEL